MAISTGLDKTAHIAQQIPPLYEGYTSYDSGRLRTVLVRLLTLKQSTRISGASSLPPAGVQPPIWSMGPRSTVELKRVFLPVTVQKALLLLAAQSCKVKRVSGPPVRDSVSCLLLSFSL